MLKKLGNYFLDKLIRANFYDDEVLLLTDFLITVVSVDTYMRANRFVRFLFAMFAFVMFLPFIAAAIIIPLQVFDVIDPFDPAYSDVGSPSPFLLIFAVFLLLIALWQFSAMRWMLRNIGAARRQ